MKLALKGLIVGLTLLACQASYGQVRIICQYLPGTDFRALGAKYSLAILDHVSGAPFVLYGCDKRKAVQVEYDLRRTDGIVWAEEDGRVAIPEAVGQKGGTIPAVGDRTALYGRNAAVLQQTGWNSDLAFSPGRPVILAILDTGLSPNQPQLWGKVVTSENFVEAGPAYDLPLAQDSNSNGIPDEAVGHGTMVAGVADQIGPMVSLAIARVADSDGFATAWTLLKGLAFAVHIHAEVANVSLGTPKHIESLDRMMEWAVQHNLVVVGAIGNSAVNKAAYPSRESKVVCVGGLLPDDTKAPFSNWDRTCDASAPATGIYSQTWTGQIGLWSGTSFAAPMVSAAIADCLRRTEALDWTVWQGYLAKSGRVLNLLNPEFKDQLGSALNIAGLNSIVQASSP